MVRSGTHSEALYVESFSMCGMAGCIAVSRCMQGLEAEQWKFLLRVLPVLAFGLALMGALVLLTRRLLWPLDSLREGLAAGFGQVFHPSGQVLYTGQVYDAKPRADAFLGLSLAEVESAFSEHWQLYSCEEKAGFVYPTFGLIFVTDCPVTFHSASAEAADVVPPVQTDMAESDSAAIPAVFPGTVIAQDGGKERPMPPQPETTEGETLSPDTVHSDLVICEVLSYREPLPGTVQPPANAGRTGTHASGWREWFSACARGEALEGIQTEKTGTFVIRFRPQTMRPFVPVGEVTAEGGGIRITTVYHEGKEQPLWYQSAVRTEAAQS